MADENIEFGSNLENLLSPFCYVPEVPLPKTLPEVPGGMYLSGFISQDCTWGCCFNHSVLKCFPVDKFFEDSHMSFTTLLNNGGIAVSSSSYTFPGGHITCATELAIHNPRTQSGMRKLLLGISYTGDNNNRDLKGAVVIFDPIRCLPMKWIEIPDPVSSITVLSHFEEGGSNRPFFNETMMAMVGIAAVGLRGGSVVIIDLGLDDPNLTAVSASDSKSASNLTYRLLYVNPHEYVIATKRHKAVSKRSLIALRFSNEPEDEMIADAFHYCRPTGESLLVLNKNSVAVTCVEYVPAIGSLLVGFTCGGFQIWRINNMELQFSSEPVYMLREEPLHVFGFSFQQPVDDPKNYCYIWVMYGKKSAECGNAHVELHSLYYERKNFIENFGFVYDGFKQCAKRLAFPLIDDFLSTESENEDYGGDGVRCSARPIRIWTQPDSELMYCAWEVGRGGVFYLGTFDLNQWYSNHTKELLYFDPGSGLCPYWVAVPVEIPDVSNFVMDLRLLPKSLMRWENPHAKLDVHLYPSSLSFRAMVLTNTGVSAFEHFGVQEKLIRKILRDGPSLMIEPKIIKKSFVRHGLEPVFPVDYGDDVTETDQDRFFILTVLLENRRPTPIIFLANAWLDGSYANVGCTIDLMIDWIGGYTVALRNVANEHWDTLFHFPESVLPPETVRYINFSNFAWTSLHRLLLTMMGPTEIYSVRRQELENMEYGLGKLVQYSSALLMMYKAQLLPACDRYFITKLSEYYEQRRQESKEALENCIYIDNQFKKSHPLMIDHLIDNLMEDVDLHEEWHIEDGQYCYPPRHVGYLVNMFMWLDADPKAVSRVFMYFLIDLSYFFQNGEAALNSNIIERKVIGDFKAVMEGSAEEYQEIWALWCLDHGSPDEILVILKENDRLYQKDGLPWCAAAVALTASGFENDVAELLLKSCPQNLAKLLFNLMTSSISKYTSLAELMVSSNLSSNDELLQEFFQISEARDRLAEFVRTKAKELPDRVKAALLTFLNNTNSVKRLSQLLMYYVHIEDFKKLQEEFVRVREILRHRNLSEIDRKMWRFQETYINHLLNTTKSSMVQQFLRLQSPHNSVRPVQSTISIKAVNANDELDKSPEPSRKEPKLPPHLRRLKLSESVAHDPLTPLRRYAGKIQSDVSAINADSDKEDDARHRRQSSRKSYSRRVSISRHSILNNTRNMHNETHLNEDRLNVTSRNTQVDLISLLKTPCVDHRAENRQKNTFLTFNQTMSKELEEANTSQLDPPPPHSIMKELDPSKPKITKKVELRFENLSLSSEEGDEKNATIYEDADENIADESNQGSVAFDCSFNSASDRSMFGNESVANISLQHTDDGEFEAANIIPSDAAGYTIQNKPVTFHRTTDLMDITEENEEQEQEIQDAPQDEIGLSSEGNQKSSNVEQPSQPTTSAAKVEDEQNQNLVSDELEKNISPRRTPRRSRSRTPTKIEVDKLELIEPETKSPPRRSRRNTRSKSKTPTREIEPPPEADSPNKSQQQESIIVHRKTELMNPVEENEEQELAINVPQDEIGLSSEGKQVSSNVEQSTHPAATIPEIEDEQNQTLVPDEPEKNSSTIRTRRSSRCRTPTREVVGEVELSETEAVCPTRRSTRNTRSKSKTPTREIERALEATSPSKSQRTRSTRSKTPTRDIEQHSVSEDSEKLVRRLTRSSKTPVRDVYVEETSTGTDSADPSAITKKRRRSSRSRSVADTSQPIASSSLIFENTQADMREEDEETQVIPISTSSNKINQGKASKSRKRKLVDQQQDLPSMLEDSGTDASEFEATLPRRSSRSRTPTREVVGDVTLVESESKSPTRLSSKNTRSKSKTPTKETDLAPKPASLNKSPAARSRRSTRSKTPTRESQLHSVAEDSPEKPVKRLTRSSKTLMRDVYIDASPGTESKSADSTTAIVKKSRRSSDRSLAETSQSEPTASSSSPLFEITQEDMRDEEEDEEIVPVPSTSSNSKGIVSKARKRRLKYLRHHQDLSTVIEDSGTDASEASVFEATIMPPAPAKNDPPKNRKIKGIKARPAVEETEPEINPVKPAKRRKAAATILDFDDDDSDVKSTVSTRSTRSDSSRRSVDSAKPKTSRRKARSSTKSTA